MAEHDFVRVTSTRSPAGTAEAPTEAGRRAAPRYCRPRLALVGSVVRLVQSGPTGNRNETYQGSYWSDK